MLSCASSSPLSDRRISHVRHVRVWDTADGLLSQRGFKVRTIRAQLLSAAGMVPRAQRGHDTLWSNLTHLLWPFITAAPLPRVRRRAFGSAPTGYHPQVQVCRKRTHGRAHACCFLAGATFFAHCVTTACRQRPVASPTLCGLP